MRRTRSSLARRESENFLRLRLSAASAVSGCSAPPRRSGLRCESEPEAEPERSLPLHTTQQLPTHAAKTTPRQPHATRGRRRN